MTRANTSRQAGDEFQARWFWLEASNLLNGRSPVSGIAWEQGPQAIDDIRIDYQPHKSTPVGVITCDHVQCKWHVRHGEFGYASLTEPSFINAKRVSWLQRAHEAFKAANRNAVRFRLITNWRITSGDPLGELIRTESGSLNIDRLFSGKTQKSAMGRLRACWQGHLSIDDDELRRFAGSLAFSFVSDSLEELRDRLNERLATVGLKQASDHLSAFIYDDLIVKLHQQGSVELDEAKFRALCDREELWDASGPLERPFTLGIRSFVHRFDALENRSDTMLDLVPMFNGRYLDERYDWNRDVDPVLRKFLDQGVSAHSAIRLVLDAHASIAIAAGRLVDVKSGRTISLEQRVSGAGRMEWNARDGEVGANAQVLTDATGDGDIVLAISVTHDVLPAVRVHCAKHLPTAHILLAQCGDLPGGTTVLSGAHAWRLVGQIVREIRAIRGVPGRRIHVFAAAPNGLLFFLGQQLGLGPMTVYEWDFEGAHGGGYRPGLEVL